MRTHRLADATRGRLRRGRDSSCSPTRTHASDTVTAIRNPMGWTIPSSERRSSTTAYNVAVQGGQGSLKGKIFRIEAHMGIADWPRISSSPSPPSSGSSRRPGKLPAPRAAPHRARRDGCRNAPSRGGRATRLRDSRRLSKGATYQPPRALLSARGPRPMQHQFIPHPPPSAARQSGAGSPPSRPSWGLFLVVKPHRHLRDRAPLSSELAAKEVEHALQVENQLSRLAGDDYPYFAEAGSPNVHLALSSRRDPRLGGGSALGRAPSPRRVPYQARAPAGTTAGYEIARRSFSHPPNWNNGSSCLTGRRGEVRPATATSTPGTITNANNSSFSITVNGNRNSVQHNISGNNDMIAINWKGGDTGFVTFVVATVRDSVTYNIRAGPT